jgi:hypothetical protein
LRASWLKSSADICLAALTLRLDKNVFIPLKAAALVRVPVRAGLRTDGCGFGNVVAALSLGTGAALFSIDSVIAGK